MYEVEIKYKLPDEAASRIEREIINGKWRFLYEVEERDVYLAHPCRNFAETDEALRIRVEKKGHSCCVLLTYKGPRIGGEGKTREEISVEVEDADKCLAVLERLGFKKVADIVKRRRVYEKDNLTLTVDDVEGLGRFVEIECITDREDLIEECVRSIKNVALELGLDDSLIERRTYLELVLERKPLY
ncbi:MAG: class IV adenylate cyclase [Crenarchaeota archaeon]|nr:class IV adenylate cyclase [Thermoproteota archaeon]